MNSIENRLRQDAESFSAQVPAEVASRLQDSLKREKRPVQDRTSRLKLPAPVMAGMAAGLVAAVAGILWLSQVGQHGAERELPVPPVTMAAYQETVTRLSQVMELRMSDEAELELELQRLNADMHRIQARVRDELAPLL